MAGVLLMTPPMFGHHSTAMYDMANPVTVTGTVTKFDWTNPHAHIYLDVENALEIVSVDALHGEGRRCHQLYVRKSQERQPGHDQLSHETGRWPHHQVIGQG
jgi:hypothetical protein